MNQPKWSSKEAAKAGQKFRREARGIFAEYQKSLFKKLDEVRVIIRPRPRIIPRKVWLWFANIFVDLNNADKALVFETPADFLTRKHHEARKREGRAPAAVDETIAEEEQGEDEYEESDEINDLLPPSERA